MSHIKLHGVKPRIQYVADGTLTTYEFPFVIFTNTDIQVYLNDILQTPETYTVSGVKNTNGGSITFIAPPPNGTIITITRDLSIERTTDFQEGGILRADTLNDEFDYQTACLQQVADSINRSMVLPPYATDTNVDLTLPTPSAGKAIVWNSDGTNLENSVVEVNALESTLRTYKESAESSATIATEKATLASDKADTATEQAQVATEKATLATQKATETANALSAKANTDMNNLTTAGKNNIFSQAVIVSKYNNGTNFYRVWSDGWIEQGGTIEVASTYSEANLLKPFSNTDYIVMMSTNVHKTVVINKNHNSQLYIDLPDDATGTVRYYACGY